MSETGIKSRSLHGEHTPPIFLFSISTSVINEIQFEEVNSSDNLNSV